jgi:hypothetical protein
MLPPVVEYTNGTFGLLRATAARPAAILLGMLEGVVHAWLILLLGLPLALVVAFVSRDPPELIGGAYLATAGLIPAAACAGLYVALLKPQGAAFLGLFLASLVAVLAVLWPQPATGGPLAPVSPWWIHGSPIGRFADLLIPARYAGPMWDARDLAGPAAALLCFGLAVARFPRHDWELRAPPPVVEHAAPSTRRSRLAAWFDPPRPPPGAAAFFSRQFHVTCGGREWFLLETVFPTVVTVWGPWRGTAWDGPLWQTAAGFWTVWLIVAVGLRMGRLFHEERRDRVLDDLRTLPLDAGAMLRARLRAVALMSLPLTAAVVVAGGALLGAGEADWLTGASAPYPGHPVLSLFYFLGWLAVLWSICALSSVVHTSPTATPVAVRWHWPTPRELGLLAAGLVALAVLGAIVSIPWSIQDSLVSGVVPAAPVALPHAALLALAAYGLHRALVTILEGRPGPTFADLSRWFAARRRALPGGERVAGGGAADQGPA